jgi:hypothetical protein
MLIQWQSFVWQWASMLSGLIGGGGCAFMAIAKKHKS